VVTTGIISFFSVMFGRVLCSEFSAIDIQYFWIFKQ
jgi:hypothetical protein